MNLLEELTALNCQGVIPIGRRVGKRVHLVGGAGAVGGGQALLVQVDVVAGREDIVVDHGEMLGSPNSQGTFQFEINCNVCTDISA